MAELFTDKTQARGNVGYEAAVAAAASAQAASDAAQAASEDAAQAALDAQNAASLADGKAVVFFQPDQPAAGTASLNDIWIDSNSTPNANQMWVFNGTTWVLGSDQTGAAALAAAATANNLATGAQAEADRKIITYVATTAPTAEEIGDLWINPSSNNEMRRWNGTSWVVVTDTRITQAASDIITLQGQYTGLNGKVDSKAVIWYQNTAPTGLAAADQGDMWVNTSTTNRVTQVWSGTQWQDVADQKGIDAYASAGTKIITYYSSTTPTPTAPAVAFTTGDLWVDLGNNSQIKRWSGSAWVLLDVASTAYIASQATDLVTNGTGLLGNNYNFATYFDYVGGDSPTGANGSFIDKTSTNKSTVIDEYISFDPAKKYKFSFQMRQTVAGQGAINRAYGFIAPYDAFNGSIAPVMYMYVANTTTTLAADLKSGDTVIRLTNAANWYGSAANPAGGTNTYLRGIIFWDYIDAAGKAWPVGSYTRNVYYIDKWADGGVDTATGIITLRAPYSGPTHLAGTSVSNSTSGGSYMYMPSCTNVLIPETWTTYSDLYSAGIMSSSTQAVALSGAATWAGGVPPGTAKLRVGWLTNYPSGGGKHAVAAVSFSDASYASQTADTAITNSNTALAGVDALDALNPNPSFVAWAGAAGTTAPDNWSVYTTAPTKETSSSYYRTPPYAVRFNCTDNTTQRGIFQGGQLASIPVGILYMTVSVDLMLFSGASFGGAGLLVDWTGLTPYRQTINFSAEIPTPILGKWYRVTKVVPRPAGVTGTQTGWSLYLMGQYSAGMGTQSIKDFSVNFCGIRPSTTEEIGSYNNSITITTKVSTFIQGTVPTSTAIGDIWYDSSNGNRMYRAASVGATTIGAGQWVLTQDTAIATAQATANGKNTNYYSTAAPTTSNTNVAGDLWFVRDPATDNITSMYQGLGGTVWIVRQLNDQAIANLNVGKLVSGAISATGTIIAGPAGGTHVELANDGLHSYVDDPTDGIPNEVVRIGTGSNDTLSIMDNTGTTLASIDTLGSINAQGISAGAGTGPVWYTDPGDGSVSLTQGVTLYGTEFTTWINNLPQGQIAYGQRTTAASLSTTESPYQQLDAHLLANRVYRVWARGYITNNTANATSLARLRYTTDGTAAGITSTQLKPFRTMHGSTANSTPAFYIERYYSAGVDRDVSFLLSSLAETSGSACYINANSSDVCEMGIEDLGWYTGDTGIDRTGGTPPPTKKTYTTTWTSTAGYTWQGGGSRRTDTTDIVQGYNSYNGDGKGLWIFPNTITSTLATSTVSKVEVYAYANHWYYNSGGTALIKVHGYTSLPGSAPSMTTATSSASWPLPGGRWVSLPSSLFAGFISGSYKGFGMGPSGGTNLTYYGRFNGGTGAQIRITYIK